MPAPFWGHLGYTPELLSQMLMATEAREAEKYTAGLEYELGREQIEAQRAYQQETLGWLREQAEQKALQPVFKEINGSLLRIDAAGEVTEAWRAPEPPFSDFDANKIIMTKEGEIIWTPRTILDREQRLVEESTGQVLTESEDLITTPYHIIGIKGGVPYSYAPAVPTIPGTHIRVDEKGIIEFLDDETGEIVDTYIPTGLPAATMAEMIEAMAAKAGVQVEREKAEAVERVEWGKIRSKERIAEAQVQATLAGYDTQLVIAQGGWELGKYGIDVTASTAAALRLSNERIEQIKATLTQRALDIKEKYGLDDLALKKYLGEMGFEVQLTGIQAGERVGMAKIAMQKYGIDIGAAIAADDRESAKFIALNRMAIDERIAREANLKDWQIAQIQVAVDYAQIEATKEGYRLKKEIADAANLTEQQRILINKYLTEIGLDLKRELGWGKLELDELLGLMGLKIRKYEAGYVPQTMQEALDFQDRKERIEARYAPLTTPNIMNVEDAEAWRAYETGLQTWLETAKTNEKIRYWESTRNRIDLLKEQAYVVAQSEGLEALSDWGRYLLDLPEEPIDVKREQDWKYKKMELQFEFSQNTPKEKRKALEEVWADAINFVKQKSGLFTILDPSIQRDDWAATLTVYKGLLMERLGFTAEQAEQHVSLIGQPLAGYLTAPEMVLPGETPAEGGALSPKLSEMLEDISGKPVLPLPVIPPGAGKYAPTKKEEAGPPVTKGSSWWRDWFVEGFKAGGDTRTIKWIQEQLISEGHTKVVATGKWDKNTERAFRTSWNRGKISQMLKGTVEGGW